MTERKMTLKGFVKKATNVTSAVSAEAFLNQYREYMATEELSPITSPIVAKIDSGSLEPDSGLEEITNAVFAHMMLLNIKKAEQSIAQNSAPAVSKPVIAKIVGSKGEELVTESFHLHQEAERWIDNRLYNGYPGSHGEVIHTKLLIKGEPQTTIITREDSIARILRKPKSAATKKIGSSSSRLGFTGRARQTHSHFSRG